MIDGPTILPLRAESVCYEVGGVTLLDGIDFEVGGGGPTVLLGPNGAGKSLTLRICHGLLRPTRGSVRWLGPGAADAARRQAMVFQRPVMLRRSAVANVVYALAIQGVPRAEREARAMAAIERAGLGRVARRAARALSGGEQQRLALARAWALEPEVLFLDEPTASLDPAATHAVEEVITAISAAGTRIVMTTHDLGQARRFAAEVIFLHGGKLVEAAPAEAFFDAPRTEEARAFLDGSLFW
ncbi:MAG: ATP-binding cassette domain-containing protein [Planctomycetota bacterium]